jgi:hypothetical protein
MLLELRVDERAFYLASDAACDRFQEERYWGILDV